MSVSKSAGRSVTSFTGKAGALFGQLNGGRGAQGASYALDEAEVLNGQDFDSFSLEPDKRSNRKPPSEIFDIAALLRLRTFLYLIAVTVLVLFQIYNTLVIKELAGKNERLREQLRISTSIITAEELKAREIQSIRYISGFAEKLELESPAVPPLELEP
ncbi:MAG: hypothetical protein HGA97_05090 [Chlorobiaceae bacterium]|nr:hypothetical protein [Chlorobiaceae bacterium]